MNWDMLFGFLFTLAAGVVIGHMTCRLVKISRQEKEIADLYKRQSDLLIACKIAMNAMGIASSHSHERSTVENVCADAIEFVKKQIAKVNS